MGSTQEEGSQQWQAPHNNIRNMDTLCMNNSCVRDSHRKQWSCVPRKRRRSIPTLRLKRRTENVKALKVSHDYNDETCTTTKSDPAFILVGQSLKFCQNMQKSSRNRLAFVGKSECPLTPHKNLSGMDCSDLPLCSTD